MKRSFATKTRPVQLVLFSYRVTFDKNLDNKRRLSSLL